MFNHFVMQHWYHLSNKNDSWGLTLLVLHCHSCLNEQSVQPRLARAKMAFKQLSLVFYLEAVLFLHKMFCNMSNSEGMVVSVQNFSWVGAGERVGSTPDNLVEVSQTTYTVYCREMVRFECLISIFHMLTILNEFMLQCITLLVPIIGIEGL